MLRHSRFKPLSLYTVKHGQDQPFCVPLHAYAFTDSYNEGYERYEIMRRSSSQKLQETCSLYM